MLASPERSRGDGPRYAALEPVILDDSGTRQQRRCNQWTHPAGRTDTMASAGWSASLRRGGPARELSLVDEVHRAVDVANFDHPVGPRAHLRASHRVDPGPRRVL